MHELSSHPWWLLHVAPRPDLLDRLVPLRMLLELVHLIDQHNIFHIGNLIRLLLHSLLLMLRLLLHLMHLLVDLLLRG